MNTQIDRDQRIKLAYEWLNKGKGTLSQAAKRYSLDTTCLSTELKSRYNFCAMQEFKNRRQKAFEDICENLWPTIKHELDTTNQRALVIMNKYGHGQHILNKLIERFDYPIAERSHRVRQENRSKTLEKQGFKVTKDVEKNPLAITGARYIAVCKPWRLAA